MSEVAAPAAAPEAPAAPAAQPAAAPAPDAPAPEAPKPDRTFSQTELDEIVERRLAKERKKRHEIETRLRVTEDLALKRGDRPADPPAPKPADTGEPVRDQFGSYEEYIEARAEWRADQKVEKKFAEREAKDRESHAKSEQEKQREAFRKSMKDSAKDIEDFDDVLGGISADDAVGRISTMAVEAAEAPGKVLYHLAKNPEEAERIASLSPGKQAREILKLEEKLSKPQAKPSKAPEPIAPLGGKTTPSDEMPDAAKEPSKWLEWRNRDLAAKRKGQRAS